MHHFLFGAHWNVICEVCYSNARESFICSQKYFWMFSNLQYVSIIGWKNHYVNKKIWPKDDTKDGCKCTVNCINHLFKRICMHLCVCVRVCLCVYTDSRESFSSSSFRLGSLCRPKVILRASTCSFRGLYSSCRRRVVSSSLFRSFSDCLMVLSIWEDRIGYFRNTL